MSERKSFGVWYWGIIVRGPFFKEERAKKAMAKVKRSSGCNPGRFRVGKYDKSKDKQVPGWTHPSALLLLKE